MSTQPIPPFITVTPPVLSESAPAPAKHELHPHRRFFIGPLPEKVVLSTEKSAKAASKNPGLFRIHSPDDDSMSQIIKENAFAFFIRQGGKEEDWGENAEQGVRDEMLKLWRESEWGTIWGKRLGGGRKEKENKRWVGGSFEVGEFLGVNILEEEMPGSVSSRSKGSLKSSLSSPPTTPPGASTASTSAGQTFITNPSDPAPRGSLGDDIPNGHSSPLPSAGSSSTLGLLRPRIASNSTVSSKHARSEIIRRPIFKTVPSSGPKSEGDAASRKKGKQRLVHYADETGPSAGSEPSGPVSPVEVLQRTGSDMDATSAGAAAEASSILEEKMVDGAMRDRMLVRVSYTRSESIHSFDEQQNRTTSHLQYEDWAEFMVVWRHEWIELYEDYSLPGKEWFIGHKHLAFTIPLYMPQTKFSLYSFVDMTFCLTCNPTEIGIAGGSTYHRSGEGTNIFVFKVKSRRRALEWIWRIWKRLGGEIPPYIEVRSASLDTRVKVDLMEGAGYSMATRDNVIALCIKVLSKMRDWKFIMEKEMQEGKTLELAWRWGTNLDWVWLEDGIEEDEDNKGWNVLCGLALKQGGKPSHLEIRMADHFPASVRLPSGEHLHEPPAIEGYLDRIKPNTQTKQAVYLATHDGNIFSLPPAQAHPPTPPGVHQSGGGVAGGGGNDVHKLSLHEAEVRRGAKQIMAANGVSDLRSIVAVRKAFQTVPQHSYNLPAGQGKKDVQDDEWANTWALQPGTEGEPGHLQGGGGDDDEGGDEGMAKAVDKGALKMRRSFELLLTTGHVIRFEAYSHRVALEWISRLRDIIIYWKHRHRIDAREEMDLAQLGSRRPRLTPHMHACMYEHDMPPEAPADPTTNLPALGSLYNWCVMHGCKCILKGGKVYTRTGLRGQYKLVHLLLVPGQLVQYRVTPKSALNHRRKRSISLLDAYVCSGYFAALALPRDQYNPDASTIPRRYQDGLEADDPEEDTLFVVWYRRTAADSTKETMRADMPALSAKRKMVVFRTRSKLERDGWCWALNCEIEKMVRKNADRERLLREAGNLAVG